MNTATWFTIGAIVVTLVAFVWMRRLDRPKPRSSWQDTPPASKYGTVTNNDDETDMFFKRERDRGHVTGRWSTREPNLAAEPQTKDGRRIVAGEGKSIRSHRQSTDDPMSQTMDLTNPLNALSPFSPLNPIHHHSAPDPTPSHSHHTHSDHHGGFTPSDHSHSSHHDSGGGYDSGGGSSDSGDSGDSGGSSSGGDQ